MTTNKTNWEDRWLGREELLCKIMGILQKQAYITNQGSNYRGETDVALNLIDDLIQSLLDKQKEEIAKDLVIKFQMEGDFGKLTPFQQTVNTYIKNRGEEIIKQIKEI